MRRFLIPLAVVCLLIIIAVAAYAFFAQKNPAEEIPGSNENPFGYEGEYTSPQTNLVTIKLSTGVAVQVPPFLPEEQPSWAGEWGYYVSGDSSDGPYSTTYIPGDAYGAPAQFLITLISEPFGASRAAAENDLRTRLKLTDAQLCALNLIVSTQKGKSAVYDGQELGLSFCPNAVPLP